MGIANFCDYHYFCTHIINTLIPQYFFLWENFICCDVFLGLYMLIWGASVCLGSFLCMKAPTQTNGEVWKTTKNTSITECFAATSTFTQYRFGKFFKAQLWKNVHNMINSTEKSDIHVFNCYLCHVRFLLTCYVCNTKIGEISDISKCFENFVSQALGVLTRVYAAELRYSMFFRRVTNITLVESSNFIFIIGLSFRYL